MGRPKKSIIRDFQLNLALTQREYDFIAANAKRAEMRLPDYGRWMLLSSSRAAPPAAPVAQVDRLVYEQLKRLGNNLNQLTRHAHITREPLPRSLEFLLQDIRAVLNKGSGGGS